MLMNYLVGKSIFSYVALFLIILITDSHNLSAKQIVITPNGVFKDCTAANKFRDGPLVKQLDREFVRYSHGTQKRYQNIIAEFERHKNNARLAYAKANANQKKEIIIHVASFFALKKLSELKPQHLPKGMYDALSPQERAALEGISSRALSLSKEMVNFKLTNKFSKNIGIREHQELLLELLSSTLGPGAKAIIELATPTIDGASIWFQWDLVKKNHKQDFDTLSKAILKLINKSPAEKIRLINKTKNIINRTCN